MESGRTSEPTTPSRNPSRESLGGGSSSDDGSSSGVGVGQGPVWMEDSSKLKRRSMALTEGTSSRMSTGSASAHAANGGDRRPMRSPRPAIVEFNVPKDKSAEKKLKVIKEMGHLGEGTPDDIAAFFIHNDGKLEPGKVADYLGGDFEENKEVLRLMLERCDFHELELDVALRKFISFIKLPGEAQKIDRIVSQFASRYMSCNPTTPIDHEDTCGILAFSLVMLNVDAHNANISLKKKMTEAQYIRNLKGICKDGGSPREQMVIGYYARITRYEWSVEERHTTPSVYEGWVYRRSSKKVGGRSDHLYAVLTTRAMYFYHGPNEQDPDRYIKLEGLGARRVRAKGDKGSFELYALAAEAADGKAGEIQGKDNVEGRMIKLQEQGPEANGPRKTISRHSSCFFTCDDEKDAALWVQLIRDYTLDEGALPDAELNYLVAPLPPLLHRGSASLEEAEAAGGSEGGGAAGGSGDVSGGVGGDAAGAAASLYQTRERRSSVARKRFSVGDSLKMLERKYAGVKKRTDDDPTTDPSPPGKLREAAKAARRASAPELPTGGMSVMPAGLPPQPVLPPLDAADAAEMSSIWRPGAPLHTVREASEEATDPTDDEALLYANPAAQSLIEAGVPRAEVLAGLRGSPAPPAAPPAPPPAPLVEVSQGDSVVYEGTEMLVQYKNSKGRLDLKNKATGGVAYGVEPGDVTLVGPEPPPPAAPTTSKAASSSAPSVHSSEADSSQQPSPTSDISPPAPFAATSGGFGSSFGAASPFAPPAPAATSYTPATATDFADSPASTAALSTPTNRPLHTDDRLTVTISDHVLGIGVEAPDGEHAVVGKLKEGSQAEALGVPIGGRFLSINGTVAMSGRVDVTAQLKAATRPTTLVISRAGWAEELDDDEPAAADADAVSTPEPASRETRPRTHRTVTGTGAKMPLSNGGPSSSADGATLPVSSPGALVSLARSLVAADEPEVVAARAAAEGIRYAMAAEEATSRQAAADNQQAVGAQEAALATLLQQCGVAAERLSELKSECAGRRAELSAVDAALADARSEMYRVKAEGTTRAAEMNAQRRQLADAAMNAATASGGMRDEAHRLSAQNAEAREELHATMAALNALRSQTDDARVRCDEITGALSTTQTMLTSSRAELERVNTHLSAEQTRLSLLLQRRLQTDGVAGRKAAAVAKASAAVTEQLRHSLGVTAAEVVAARSADGAAGGAQPSTSYRPLLALAERVALTQTSPNANNPPPANGRITRDLEAPRALLRAGGVFLRWADGLAAPFLFWIDESDGEGALSLAWRSPSSAERRPPSAMRIPLARIAKVESGWGAAAGGSAAPPQMLHECGWSVFAHPSGEGPTPPLLLFAKDKLLRDSWVTALSSLAGAYAGAGAAAAAPVASDTGRINERLARARNQGRGGGRPGVRSNLERPLATVPQYRTQELAT